MNLTVENRNSLNVSKASYFGRGEVKSGMILGKPGHGKMIRIGKAK